MTILFRRMAGIKDADAITILADGWDIPEEVDEKSHLHLKRWLPTLYKKADRRGEKPCRATTGDEQGKSPICSA